MATNQHTSAKLVHAMVRVLDESRSLAFYEKAFDLKPADRIQFDDFTLIYLRNAASPFELELTVNHDRTAPYTPGDGYGHLAVVVEDLDAERARLDEAGLAPGPIRALNHAGTPLARFFFIQDPDGYKIEVIERAGRFA
ncbi:lactoylglutathione lyase [Pseudochelatococcus lubricantis]|uniref:Aldoketomutase n=1 Tax=Pseudochelatococcus lubricantis TaxID=1538102 RepID=A0ABX0V076_9HYPH|nr:VOC family protein [Pseudochelatococcus lubricantis]NIJ56511.1 lactoylglutathione lyase [Pseudochelatococcus lubricantis]